MDSRQVRAAAVPGAAGHSRGTAGPPAVGRGAGPGRGRRSPASGPCATRAARHQRRGPAASLPPSPGSRARPRCHHAAAVVGTCAGHGERGALEGSSQARGSLLSPKGPWKRAWKFWGDGVRVSALRGRLVTRAVSVLLVRRRRGRPRRTGPHGAVLRPPGWKPAVRRHPSPARLPG